MDTFDLHIDLGNDTMRDALDVAAELRKTAALIETGHDEGRIADTNGNTVGRYGFDLGVLLPERGTVELRAETALEAARKDAGDRARRAVDAGQPVAAREWADAAKALGDAINAERADVGIDERLQLHAERDDERDDVELEPQILLFPEAGQTRCIACGYDASFQPPEIVDCPRCHEPLYSRRAENTRIAT